MLNPIVIFLFIGTAHWAAHVMNCEHCFKSSNILIRFVLEMATHILGWPIDFIAHMDKVLKARKLGPAPILIGDFKIERIENETQEQFEKRLGDLIGEAIAKNTKERAYGRD